MEDQVDLKRKYFWLVIVGVGSSSIWLPFLLGLFTGFENFAWRDVPLNLTTYYLGLLVAGCIDKGLTLFENGANRPRAEFLRIVAILLITALVVIITVLCTLHAFQAVAAILSIVGVTVGLRLWWNVHVTALQDPLNAVGGRIL